jgi:hypothetical protein
MEIYFNNNAIKEMEQRQRVNFKPLLVFSPTTQNNNIADENTCNEKKEKDEIYKMGTTVFMHLLSGIRYKYQIHEGYFGEEYKLRN